MSLRTDRRASAWLPPGLLAAVCYVPLLLTHAGKVGADTKTYLYLDPGRLLERAVSMWDPNVGLGTVPHQNIGYLWPMGPWFWFFERIGVPDWVAQRLWLGSIMFLAGLGVRYLLRTLGQHGSHVAASMFVYALSPYVLTLGARISALLLPFAGLPWMIALVARSVRVRGWLHPALFALLVTTVGSTNATALVLVGLAPLLWLPFAVLVLGEATIGQGFRVLVRIGVLSVGVSLWWMAGLYCQGAFGLDVLRYSETARTVAEASTAPELLRGLGYWFFYGDDKVGPWIEPSVPYTQNPVLLVGTYLLAGLGLLSAGFVRWRYRAFFVGLVLVGLVVGVGAHPWGDPPLWGRVVKVVLLSETGMAMRSLPRAVPLLALGLSVLAGMGIAAIGAWSRRMARPLAAGTMVLAVLCLPPLWTGNMVASNLERPEEVPDYWFNAARFLDSRGRGEEGWATRVLEVPGADFASYRWGNTVDPITPGIMDRPYAARELIPYGSPLSADLLIALDRQMQEGVLEPAAIAPVARFLGAGDVTLRADLQYERYNLPRPRQLWALLTAADGLGSPTGFGGNAPNVADPALPLEDELELSSPPDLADPPKVAVFPVEGPAGIIRAIPAGDPVVVAGDGEGLVNAAAAGLLSGHELVLYSASLAGKPATLRRELARSGATLVLTDTNRRAANRWGTVHENDGSTEAAGESALETDLTDNRLPIFPDATDDAATVSEYRGGVSARATAYGNPVTYTPENRAANAVDDDSRTAWSVGGFSPVDGERIELRYTEPRTTDRATLTQANTGVQNRWITSVRLRFDGGEPTDLDLDASSRATPGQTITFGERRFSTLSIEVLDTDVGRRDRYDNLSAVGFADIRLGAGDRRLDEVIRLPRDLLRTAGEASAGRPLAVVVSRLRSRPTAALRDDQEPSMARSFRLPTARSFTITGKGRLSTRAPSEMIDDLLGVTATGGGPLLATSSRRLPGDLRSGAVSAIDDDPTTHFSPGFLDQAGDFVRYRLDRSITFDRMNLRLLNDGRHSVPTRIRIEADGKVAAGVDLPAIRDQAIKDGAITVPLRFPAVTGREITVVIERARDVLTNDWISELPVVMPVGIVELGISGLRADVPTGPYDSGCRNDLLTADGRSVPLRLTGTVADAVAGRALQVSACGGPIELGAGDHLLRSAEGKAVGLDLDQLLLSSPSDAGRSLPRAARRGDAAAPTVTVVHNGRDRIAMDVGPRASPTWVVLGQSHSLGWKATAAGRDLGQPVPVNGYANAWLVPAGGGRLSVHLEWAPQRVVRWSIIASLMVGAVCVALVVVALRRGRRAGSGPAPASAGDQPRPFKPSLLWQSSGAPPSIRTTAITTVAVTLTVLALIGPFAALAVGPIVLAVLRWRRARALTVLGPAAALATSGLFTIGSQIRHGLPSGFEWPSYFAEVHSVAYAGVALLAVDVVVERLWTGRWWSPTDADRATAEHP